MLHYLVEHLEDRQITKVVIHVEINDILRGNQSSTDGLLQYIKYKSLTCKGFDVKKIYILRLAYTTRINFVVSEKKHDMTQNFCQKCGWFCVDNKNIRRKHLYKDDLHLMEEGKIILARNFS